MDHIIQADMQLHKGLVWSVTSVERFFIILEILTAIVAYILVKNRTPVGLAGEAFLIVEI